MKFIFRKLFLKKKIYTDITFIIIARNLKKYYLKKWKKTPASQKCVILLVAKYLCEWNFENENNIIIGKTE